MTMTRTSTLLRCRLPLLLALFAVGAAHAQQSGLKIAVVNVQRMLEQMPQTQKAMSALQEEFAPRQRDLVAMQQSLQTKQDTYKRDASVMGEAERAKLERDIREQTRDLQRADDELQEDANIRRNEVLSQLQGSLVQAVQTYARQAGYDLVVAEYLYAGAGIDITDDVLSAVREQFEQEADSQ